MQPAPITTITLDDRIEVLLTQLLELHDDAFVRDPDGIVLNPAASRLALTVAGHLAVLMAERDGDLPPWCRKPVGITRPLESALELVTAAG